MGRMALRILFFAALLTAGVACSKEDTVLPTQPRVNPPTGLYAVPPTVSVGIGGVQHVSVSGGTPPYSIVAGPSAIATAQISNADSSIAIIKIMGVTAASDTTAVTVKDNTQTVPKTVSVPVTVF